MQFREKIHKSHLKARGETVIVLVYGDLLPNVRHGVLPFSPAGEVESINQALAASLPASSRTFKSSPSSRSNEETKTSFSVRPLKNLSRASCRGTVAAGCHLASP